LTQVSSRKTKRSGSSWSCRCCQCRRSRRTSSRSRSAAVSVFFERNLQRPQGIPQGSETDLDAEVIAEFLQGSVRLFGDGGAEFGLMPEVEGAAAVDGRAGGDLAGLGEALEEGANPLGGDGILAGDRCIG